uniref:Uncharacterized protein n=1 Tax=Panagrolaimus sp. JU765 TaxID=591449 RepID=A0AC34QR44_9BILA
MEVGVGSFEGFVCLLLLLVICILLCFIAYYLKKANEALRRKPKSCCKKEPEVVVQPHNNRNKADSAAVVPSHPETAPLLLSPGAQDVILAEPFKGAVSTTTVTTYRVVKKEGEPDEITTSTKTIEQNE